MPVFAEEGFARLLKYARTERASHAQALTGGTWTTLEAGKVLVAKIETLDRLIEEAAKITGTQNLHGGTDL